ncbi:hypothetical protein ACSMFR_12845 [Listeria aquatica]|uniref:Uncharacterized protein n=2 Tax=Listeria aquatica TaxID=1494960 RepID=W7AUQ7_9LIST|nr:hypothetical protein [Listeria aquatica]EUJ16980.1 hypothetical protein MAQA_14594 [Listeria aquatica FSL S10-1188]MBC1522271.1 hypothetical protein [Listeria aquatica]
MTFINPWDERFIYTIRFILPEQPRKILTRTIIEKQLLDKEKVIENWLDIFPQTIVKEVEFSFEAMERNERKFKAFKHQHH